MVLPLGGAPGSFPPTPPALLRYTKWLWALAGSYGALIVLSFVSGEASAMSNLLNYVLVLVFLMFMLLRTDQCMSQCIMVFFLWTVMSLFFDIFHVLEVAFTTKGANGGNMFSTSCPEQMQ